MESDDETIMDHGDDGPLVRNGFTDICESLEGDS